MGASSPKKGGMRAILENNRVLYTVEAVKASTVIERMKIIEQE